MAEARVVEVGQFYGEKNRPEGRPDRRWRVVRVNPDEVVIEVVGRLDARRLECSCLHSKDWHKPACPYYGVGLGLRSRVKPSLLGDEDHPLVFDPKAEEREAHAEKFGKPNDSPWHPVCNPLGRRD